MANGATASGHGMFSLRAGSRIGASWVEDKVPPPRSRFSAGAACAACADDSFTFRPSAPDPSDSAKPLDVRSEKPLFSDDSAAANLRRSRKETSSEKAPLSPPPVPPPFPSSIARKPSSPSNLQDPCSCSGSFISDHVLDKWDQVFLEGANADITVCTNDGSRIYAHSAVLVCISKLGWPLSLSWQISVTLAETFKSFTMQILGLVQAFLKFSDAIYAF